MSDLHEIENFISKFPIYQYAFGKPSDVPFSEELRDFCKKYCPKYDTSWSCPPAIPRVEKCRSRCMYYDDVLVFSTVSRNRDINDREARRDSQKDHEQLTTLVESYLKENGYEMLTLTSDACNICQKCTFPHDYCKFPDEMHPCIESYGIVISTLAERACMDCDMGERLYIWFTIIFFKKTPEADAYGTGPDISGETKIIYGRDNRKKV